MSEFKSYKEVIAKEVDGLAEKRRILKNLDMLVLDNSLRESTVGQLRGHTLENKWTILNEVKKCGFKHIIVASFSHMPRVDDAFVKELCEKETDMSTYFSFSEVGKDPKELPVALKKMREYKLRNPIFEIDLAQSTSLSAPEMCALLKTRMDWAYKNLAKDAKILVNLRDFPFAMIQVPDRVFKIVKFLATTQATSRPFGIIFEEPTGRFLPEQIAGWTKAIRKLMDDCGWKEGHLLAHVHKKWDFGEVTQLEALSSGADGVWASICEEGAALGHACSSISIMNLIRMGNKKVQEKYNCTYLRQAAINVTKATTGGLPHPKQVIYGARALDMAFDFGGIAGGHVGKHEFDLAKFFGVEAPKRISTLASADMVKERLIHLFGQNKQFTDEMASKMKALMIEDLKQNRKEEYTSHVGLAILFDRAGGKLTSEMSDAIESVKVKSAVHQQLLKDVRAIWDEWDTCEWVSNDDCLEFHSFYNGFMSPFFGCYECEDTKKGLQAIDMDKDNRVDWKEFAVYLKWALRQYPDIANTDDLLTTAFTKGLIPSMRDEMVKKAESSPTKRPC